MKYLIPCKRFAHKASKRAVKTFFLTALLCAIVIVATLLLTRVVPSNAGAPNANVSSETVDNRENAQTTEAKPNNSEEEHPEYSKYRQYDFDNRYAAKYVNYTWLVEDPINVSGFSNEVLKLLDMGKFDEAKEKVESTIDNYLNRFTPEGRNKDKDSPYPYGDLGSVANLQPMTANTMTDGIYSKLAQIHGLTLELNGEYEQALLSYRLVFGANKKLMRWTDARLFYECGDHERAFREVCNVIQTFYDLSPDDVDVVIQKVKEAEDKRKAGDKTIDTNYRGVEIEVDKKNRTDLKALELYRIREYCGRFICPNQVYKFFMYGWQPPVDGAGAVQLIRDDYAKFMDFMEEEYQKSQEPPLSYSERMKSMTMKRNPYGGENLSSDNREVNHYMRLRFDDTMALLRKIKELPY